MGTVNLTIGEREVLEAIVKVIQEERSFNLEDINLPSAPVRGFVSSLQRKGMLTMNNGECYYDGQVTEAGLHEVENSKVNNEQEVKQSNKSKNMAKKENLYGKGKSILAAGITMGEKTEEKPAVDNFDAPVMDERILKLNEYKAVKMSTYQKAKDLPQRKQKNLLPIFLTTGIILPS